MVAYAWRDRCLMVSDGFRTVYRMVYRMVYRISERVGITLRGIRVVMVLYWVGLAVGSWCVP